MKAFIDKLQSEHRLTKSEFIQLLDGMTPEISEYLFEKSRQVARARFGNQIYTRGLIEFSNYCKNNCYYCGIRAENRQVQRYRLSLEQILSCCEQGYHLGFRTFVLQGGEDPYFTDERFVEIISRIRHSYPDCAITLSLGERDFKSYEAFYQAGANRYLLRHETATEAHYQKLHPANQLLKTRKQCLLFLKQIGYQVGTGFMVGSPYQTTEHLTEDLLFIWELKPQMVGIGPFLPHHQTPFADKQKGSLEQTLFLIGILRLMLPNVLLPATTALGTIDPNGREKGILAGANVVMPNLSPIDVRKRYTLYDNKICMDEEAAESREKLNQRMCAIGYELTTQRGDYQEYPIEK